MKSQEQIRTFWSSEESVLPSCVEWNVDGYKNFLIMAVTFGLKGKDGAGCHGTGNSPQISMAV